MPCLFSHSGTGVTLQRPLWFYILLNSKSWLAAWNYQVKMTEMIVNQTAPLQDSSFFPNSNACVCDWGCFVQPLTIHPFLYVFIPAVWVCRSLLSQFLWVCMCISVSSVYMHSLFTVLGCVLVSLFESISVKATVSFKHSVSSKHPVAAVRRTGCGADSRELFNVEHQILPLIKTHKHCESHHTFTSMTFMALQVPIWTATYSFRFFAGHCCNQKSFCVVVRPFLSKCAVESVKQSWFGIRGLKLHLKRKPPPNKPESGPSWVPVVSSYWQTSSYPWALSVGRRGLQSAGGQSLPCVPSVLKEKMAFFSVIVEKHRSGCLKHFRNVENVLARSKALVLLMNVEVKGASPWRTWLEHNEWQPQSQVRSPLFQWAKWTFCGLFWSRWRLCEVRSFFEIRQEMGNQCAWPLGLNSAL